VVVPDPRDLTVTRGAQQLLGAVLADRLEQPVAHRAAGVLGDDQALVDQRSHQVENVQRVSALAGAHGLRGRQVEPAREHRQPQQRLALRRIQQAERPVHGRLQRLLAWHGVPAAAGEQPEPLVQSFGDLRERHRGQARGRQLQRERHSVKATAERGDQRGGRCIEGEAGIVHLSALGEQPDRVTGRDVLGSLGIGRRQ
jgi:hypothetical protein